MMSIKHVGRDVDKFAERHNLRGKDAIDRMVLTANRMEGKRFKNKELVA